MEDLTQKFDYFLLSSSKDLLVVVMLWRRVQGVVEGLLSEQNDIAIGHNQCILHNHVTYEVI